MNLATFDPAPWAAAIATLGLDEPAGEPLALPISMRRRRSWQPRLADPRASVGLVDDDGVLRWVYRPPAADAPRERVRRAGLLEWVKPLTRIDYRDVGPNEVTA